ncbi:MAG: DUF4229 domain-containing protein [Candidatus Nanopelagicales bacterium]
MSQDETAPAVDAPAERGGHPVLVYTALRFLLLAVTAGVLYLLGLRNILLLLVFAFLISGVISVFALNRRREVAAVEVVSAVQKVNARIDESARAEDVPDDDLDASGTPTPATGAASEPAPADGAAATGTPAPEPTTAPADGTAATGTPAPAPSPAPKPTKRDIPADDDLDDLEPTDRP